MNGFLVDTNVISEILRTAPDARVAAWSQRSARQMLLLSEESIETQIPHWFEGRILSVTQAIAERWGELDGIRQLAGCRLNAPDGMIAATPLEHDLTAVTRNMKDFAWL